MTRPITPFLADILREIMNIGSAHAVTALAKLTDERIAMDVPQAEIVSVEQIPDRIGGTGDMRSMSLRIIRGDVSGIALLSFSTHDAQDIVERTSGGLHMEEIGGKLLEAFFESVAKFLSLGIAKAEVHTFQDLSGAILGSVLSDIGRRSDTALLAQCTFRLGPERDPGRVIMLFDPDSTQRILHAANRKISRS